MDKKNMPLDEFMKLIFGPKEDFQAAFKNLPKFGSLFGSIEDVTPEEPAPVKKETPQDPAYQRWLDAQEPTEKAPEPDDVSRSRYQKVGGLFDYMRSGSEAAPLKPIYYDTLLRDVKESEKSDVPDNLRGFIEEALRKVEGLKKDQTSKPEYATFWEKALAGKIHARRGTFDPTTFWEKARAEAKKVHAKRGVETFDSALAALKEETRTLAERRAERKAERRALDEAQAAGYIYGLERDVSNRYLQEIERINREASKTFLDRKRKEEAEALRSQRISEAEDNKKRLEEEERVALSLEQEKNLKEHKKRVEMEEEEVEVSAFMEEVEVFAFMEDLGDRARKILADEPLKDNSADEMAYNNAIRLCLHLRTKL